MLGYMCIFYFSVCVCSAHVHVGGYIYVCNRVERRWNNFIILLALSTWVFMFKVSMYIHVHRCAQVYGQRPKADIILDRCPPCLLRQNLSDSKLTNLAGLLAEQAPGILLSLTPQKWDFRWAQPCLVFYVGSGDPNSISHESTLSIESSLQPSGGLRTSPQALGDFIRSSQDWSKAIRLVVDSVIC